jgi:tRNA threonylcarbamoyladenosine biosynthesis protein TsaE
VVAFFGKMGVGKTTLIKALCNQLGVEDVVSSPTFALVNEYLTEKEESVFHFDFYRIESIEEVFDIGYEEYIYSGNFCFIEWPEMMVELLPESYVYLTIEENDDGTRVISYRVPD